MIFSENSLETCFLKFVKIIALPNLRRNKTHEHHRARHYTGYHPVCALSDFASKYHQVAVPRLSGPVIFRLLFWKILSHTKLRVWYLSYTSSTGRGLQGKLVPLGSSKSLSWAETLTVEPSLSSSTKVGTPDFIRYRLLNFVWKYVNVSRKVI